MKLLMAALLITNLNSFAEVDKHDPIESHNKELKRLEVVMKDRVKDTKKCSSLIKRYCGEGETKACAQRVARKLPKHCQEMITGFSEVNDDISGGLSACTGVAIKKCKLADNFDEQKGGLAKYQACLEMAMKSDENCISTIKVKVNSANDSDESNSEIYKEFIR
jgi:hypothetical protein